MNKEERNIGSIILFILIILGIGIGGYFLINNQNKGNNTNNNPDSKVDQKIKIDENKQYIYYTNEEVLSEELELRYKDINININTDDAKKLQEKLNNDMKNIKSKLVKMDQVDVNVPKEIVVDNIYSAEMIDYTFNETNKYLSIEVNNYTYVVEERAGNAKLSYYVFDLENGKLLSNHDLLSKEGKTDQDVRSRIRKEIQNDETVDLDATLATDYELSVASNGKLVINTVVKTSEGSYTVNIEM